MGRKPNGLASAIAKVKTAMGCLFGTKAKIDSETSKKALMGEMMGDVVHQWRQPLNAIKMSNSIISMMCREDKIDRSEVAQYAIEISNQVELMRETMETFKDFIVEKPKARYNVWQKVAEAIHLVESVYAAQGIEVVFRRELKGDFTTMGYENELKQVLINVMNNARDVIEERKPTVRKIEVSVAVRGRKIIVRVKDYAGGISQDILPRVFEPGFTTKSHTNGMGIGLDMTKRIVNKNGGSIYAANWEGPEGEGAIFSVVLDNGE